MDIDRLITLVQANPGLWDKRTTIYKNGTAKEQIWAKIAEELQMDVDRCKVKWRSMRDRFTRETKKYAKLNSEGTRWRLYYKLSFLQNCLRPSNLEIRDIYSNQPKAEESTVYENLTVPTSDANEVQEDIVSSFLNFRGTKPSSQTGGDVERNVDSQNSEWTVDQRQQQVQIQQEQIPLVPEPKPDDCDHFGKLVASRMRMLPIPKRTMLEMRILSQINEELNTVHNTIIHIKEAVY